MRASRLSADERETARVVERSICLVQISVVLREAPRTDLHRLANRSTELRPAVHSLLRIPGHTRLNERPGSARAANPQEYGT
jgi:hypothetical protein